MTPVEGLYEACIKAPKDFAKPPGSLWRSHKTSKRASWSLLHLGPLQSSLEAPGGFIKPPQGLCKALFMYIEEALQSAKPLGIELSSMYIYYAFDNHIYFLSRMNTYVYLVWQIYFVFYIYANNFGHYTHICIMPIKC